MSDLFQRHGACSWCELTTTDVDAAKAFCTQLLGWTTADMSAEGMTYTVVKTDDTGVGGIMSMPPQAAGSAGGATARVIRSRGQRPARRSARSQV